MIMDKTKLQTIKACVSFTGVDSITCWPKKLTQSRFCPFQMLVLFCLQTEKQKDMQGPRLLQHRGITSHRDQEFSPGLEMKCSTSYLNMVRRPFWRRMCKSALPPVFIGILLRDLWVILNCQYVCFCSAPSDCISITVVAQQRRHV